MATTPNDAVHYRRPSECAYNKQPLTATEISAANVRSSLRSSIPFSALEDPEFAQVIADNEPWYQAIIESEPETAPEWHGQNMFRASQIANRFELRAMLHLGNGDTAKGLESIRFISRLAERQREQLSLFRLMVSSGIDNKAMAAARSALLTADEPSPELIDCVMEITRDIELNQCFATSIDKLERYRALEFLCGPMTSTGPFPQPSHAKLAERLKFNWLRHRIDWHELADFYHETMDGFSQRYRIEDPVRRAAELAEFRLSMSSRLSGSKASLGDWNHLNSWNHVVSGNATDGMKRWVLDGLVFKTVGLTEADISRRRLTRLTIYLAAFRRKTGHYPKSLSELDGTIPEEHANIRLDALNKPFVYEVTETGFQLRLSNPDSTIPVGIEWPLPE